MSVEDITERLQAVTVTASDCVPFHPTATPRWRDLQLSAIPRYLFRISTPRSACSIDDVWAKSADAVLTPELSGDDIFQTRSDSEAAHSVANHLNWRRGQGSSNLVSWTSSLLYALQYVLYRHVDRRDGPDMADIEICVIDTTEFEPRVFIRDMDPIEAFAADHAALQKLRDLRTGGEYYFGEYLSQGALRIEGKCQIISAEAMIGKGLLSLRPEFEMAYYIKTCGWAKDVVEMRDSLYEQQQQQPPSVRLETFQSAIEIGQLFGPHWRLPIATNLVALTPGHLDPGIIKVAFRNQQDFTLTLQPSHALPAGERSECANDVTTVIAYPEMPELTRAERVMRIIYASHVQMVFDDGLSRAEWALRLNLGRSQELLENASEFMMHEERAHVLEQISTVIFLAVALWDEFPGDYAEQSGPR